MVTVEVIVPAFNQSYDFQLDESTKLSLVLEEIIEMLCRKEKRNMPASFDAFCLAAVEQGIFLHMDATLQDYHISNGARLILT